MKYMKQIGIIATISFIAELLHFFLPLPIPASVYGLVILFVLLCLKIIKLPQVEDVADWMLSVMPIFFIAPSVGLINSFESIKGQVIPLVFICFVSHGTITTILLILLYCTQYLVICQEKSRTKIKKIFLPNLCILPIEIGV